MPKILVGTNGYLGSLQSPGPVCCTRLEPSSTSKSGFIGVQAALGGWYPDANKINVPYRKQTLLLVVLSTSSPWPDLVKTNLIPDDDKLKYLGRQGASSKSILMAKLISW